MPLYFQQVIYNITFLERKYIKQKNRAFWGDNCSLNKSVCSLFQIIFFPLEILKEAIEQK